MLGSKKVFSDEKKFLMKKLYQNGFVVKNEVLDFKVLGKRFLEKNYFVGEFFLKKFKVLVLSILGKMK